jgi:hypothetical protein
MLVSRLLRTLLRFLSPGIVPDGEGGAPAPATSPAAAPAAAPAADDPGQANDTPAGGDADQPEDKFGGLQNLLDTVGAEGGEDKPAAPTPAPKPPEGSATPAPPAATPAPAAAAKPEEKKGDIDLTPPEGMSARAQERWSQLTERVKVIPELERRATEATTQLQAVRTLVQDSGLSPDEFRDMLALSKLSRSADPAQAKQALQRLDAIRADIAIRAGVDAPGIDLLAKHPDLKAEVDAMTLTKERAQEIARGRELQARQQLDAQGQDVAAKFQQTVQQAAASMEQTLAAKAGTPGHDAKLAYIAEHFGKPENLQKFVTTYQPQQWQEAILWMYDHYTPPAATPAPPQPLRPQNTRTGRPQNTGPVTAESAIESALSVAGLG